MGAKTNGHIICGHIICGHITNYIKGSACPLAESLWGTCMASVYNTHVFGVLELIDCTSSSATVYH